MISAARMVLTAPKDAIGLVVESDNGVDWIEPGSERPLKWRALATVSMGKVTLLVPGREIEIAQVLRKL